MSRTAVIVIDMLNDFVTGPIASPRIHHIIEPIKDLCDYARKHNMPVIYSNDSHTPEVDKEFKVWGPHAVVGTKGAEVIDELEPQPGDHIIPKKTYSGFFQTPLELVLRELDVDTVIITGWQAATPPPTHSSAASRSSSPAKRPTPPPRKAIRAVSATFRPSTARRSAILPTL